MEKEKLVKTAKGLDTVFKILQIIIRICAIACVVILGVFTAVYFTHPEALTEARYDQVDIGPLSFTLTQTIGLNSDGLLPFVWITFGAGIALIAVAYYAIRVIRNILAPMTQGDPFHPTVSRQIRKLAFASLVVGILEYMIGAVETFNAFHIFDLNELLPSSQIQSVTANYSFDLTAIVVFFVLLLLSYIFRYGEELQRLSDETL